MSGYNTTSTRIKKSDRVADFDRLIPCYIETKAALGTQKSNNYEAHGNGISGGTRCINYCVPTSGDFVADVELQAKRALVLNGNWEMYKLFMGVFADDVVLEADVAPEKIFEIKWRVGVELDNNIIPLHDYLNGRMVKRAN